jgi:beta-1,4-mannooligosaccharide/beta-1,4-mannosyl-N-acetylglucosamine phosphorylase
MRNMIFKKYEGNPLLSPHDMPGNIMYLLNPGAIKHHNEYILMMDAATAAGPIVFWLARSHDGINFVADPKPVNWPEAKTDYHESCVYDPRITKIDNEYLIMFASSSFEFGTRLGLVKTKDFVKFERIEQERTENAIRNGVIFPEKINGRYVRFDRPMSGELEPSNMWLSYSEDLVHWRDSEPLMDTRPGFWDRYKIGAGAVPIKTEKGWLEIYHGVGETCNGFIYSLGAVLLDLENPAKIIARTDDAIMWPEYDYELKGRVPNVVFTCNALIDEDNNIKIYYGAADTCIGLAEAKLDDLIAACLTPNAYLSGFFKSAQ